MANAEGKNMAGTKDPDLHLIVYGVPRRGQSVLGGIYTFRVPSGAGRVIIASRSVVPLDTGGADPRRLGVPVHRIVLRGGVGTAVEIGPDHPGLTDGFHDNEGTHRWTNGRAAIPPELLTLSGGEVTIEVHIGTIELEYRA
jgi:hypothetical protein